MIREIKSITSALFYAKKGTTPTLFIIGNPKLGGVDPENTVRELHEKLKEKRCRDPLHPIP